MNFLYFLQRYMYIVHCRSSLIVCRKKREMLHIANIHMFVCIAYHYLDLFLANYGAASVARTCIHVYSRHSERKTKQQNTKSCFQSSGGIRTHDLTPPRCDALPTELLRQLSWLSSNHPYTSRQGRAKQVS